MGVLNKIFPLFLLLLLTGCYEEFTPETDTAPVLCINSLITAGEPIDVAVTRSWLYTQGNNTQKNLVTDATVAIYANGKIVNDDYLPQEGDRIRITAESPSYGKAEAEVTVPVSVPIESLEWEALESERSDYTNEEHEYHIYTFALNAKLKINDPTNREDYYLFSYTSFNNDAEETPEGDVSFEFNPGRLNYKTEPIFAEHIGVFDAVNGSDSDGFTFFTDRKFSGCTYTLTLQFENMNLICSDMNCTDDTPDCGLILTLSTISHSYYNWCNYLWFINNAIMADFGDMGLGDPIWGYSNVSTGAGIVAAQSIATYTLNLKDLLKKVISNTIN